MSSLLSHDEGAHAQLRRHVLLHFTPFPCSSQPSRNPPETLFGPASSLHWDVPPSSLLDKFSLEQVMALNCGHRAFLSLSFYGQCTEVEHEVLSPTILLWNIFGYYWCLQAVEEANLS